MTLLAGPTRIAKREAAGRQRRSVGLSGIIALASVAATTALLLTLGLTRFTPVFYGDEIGYLANTISIAGGPDIVINADSYYPGWSLVLVPLWWIFRDPFALYRGAVILSAVSSVATIPVLAALGRRLGLRTSYAIIAACVVVALPAHALMAGFALAESFLGLVVAASALFAVQAARTGLARWYAAAGATAGFAFVVHGRVAGLVVATLVWGILVLLRRQWRAGSALIASAAIVAGTGYALYRHLEVVVYRSTGREADGVAKLFGSQPSATALGTSGQVWYALVASAGLAIPGVLFLVFAVVREWRARKPGWATWLAIGVLGIAAVSITYVSGSVSTRDRLDLFVYGRYLEPATDLLAFFGLILLVRMAPAALRAPARLTVRWRRIALGSVITFAAVGVGYGLLARAAVPTADHTKSGWNPMNVLGITQYGWKHGAHDASLPLVQSALIGGGVLVALLVLSRILRSPAWMLAGALVFALTSSIVGQARTVAPAYAGFSHAFTLTAAVERYPGATVAFVEIPDPSAPGRSSVISQNAYEYFLAPRVVPVIVNESAVPKTDLAIARQEWPAGAAAGWHRVASDTRYDNALWVRPGFSN